ncbi:MAG: CRISPR-associated helicase Cas3' [Methanobacterium sp.]|uniref:CRISPR-associated helicase Cas3' n=1 Tax=Methanobacterium sp. TaxID=2164 RepID=UPI003D661139|nr:CRISPR-associated helicase Cas3' [Methanobacterium sp.]
MLIAKYKGKNGKNHYQTLYGHSIDSLKILYHYFEKNHISIKQFCKRWDLNCGNFMQNLFITIYFHDIGKATKQFQDNIKIGKHSQYYPHSFFAFPIFLNFYLNGILNSFLKENDPILLEFCSVLGHHTQLHKNIYEDIYNDVNYQENEIIYFINSLKTVYKELKFYNFFELEEKRINELNILNSSQIKGKIKQIIHNSDIYPNKIKLKSVFTYFFSILQLCDDYSSANFSKFIESYNGDIKLFDSVIENPEEYVLKLNINNPVEVVLGDHQPHDFQSELFEKSPKFSVLFAPCGRGKTEASLLWALNSMENYDRNKIVFALPTQVTSNAMWERLCTMFGKGESDKEKMEDGKKYVGLFHGKSFIKLKSEVMKENEDLSDKDISEIQGDVFKGNVFFKPITVTTIDHLIYSFVHGFRQADFALGNLQNATIIFDEVHYYEKNTLNHLITLFRLLKQFDIPHLLMSGTLPDFLRDELEDYVEVIDKEGIEYTPFSFNLSDENIIKIPKSTDENEEDPLINQEILDDIVNKYNLGLKQFIILNTIKRAQEFYKILKNNLEEKYDDPNVILYHSQFIYNDRVEKESEIKNRSKKGPFILIATQVIEISLDISCDVMYTEIAPPDAIGQRGGRLNRKGKVYSTDGILHEMKIFAPESHLPYNEELLQKTRNNILKGPTSYKKIKKLCDEIYDDYKLEKTNLEKIFKECTLFGYRPIEIAFGEDEGRLLQIREEKVQKIDVIPCKFYKNEEKNLNVENQVQIPLWWYQNDQKEHGEELEYFYIVSKLVGRKERYYMICKMDYNNEIGFNYGKKAQCTSDDNIF